MKEQERQQQPLEADFQRILGRDGFSPDLPGDFSSAGSTRGLSWGLKLFTYMLSGLQVGSLDLSLPNGATRRFEGVQPGPHGVLRIKSDRVIRHVLRGGEVGFGEAYLDDCWDSPDLARLLAVLYLNEPYYKGPFEKNLLGRIYGYWQHRRRANTKTKARENIEYHYDLGNEFYKMWLDDTMAYSSGMFIQPNETLMDAQLNKFRLMFERLELKPEHHLLEIGSGWGGFSMHAAKTYGCRVTTVTISQQQFDEASRRIQAAGLGEKIQILLCDYRDLRGQFDKIASI